MIHSGVESNKQNEATSKTETESNMESRRTTVNGGGRGRKLGGREEELSKKEKKLTDTDYSVVIARRKGEGDDGKSLDLVG